MCFMNTTERIDMASFQEHEFRNTIPRSRIYSRISVSLSTTNSRIVWPLDSHRTQDPRSTGINKSSSQWCFTQVFAWRSLVLDSLGLWSTLGRIDGLIKFWLTPPLKKDFNIMTRFEYYDSTRRSQLSAISRLQMQGNDFRYMIHDFKM